ncbi:gb [Venturia nashicola]|nr:gb [Venturia nashicola]
MADNVSRPESHADKSTIHQVDDFNLHEKRGDDTESLASVNAEPMSFKKFMALVAMAFLWTGSQIPLYLYGAIPPYVYSDIGGADRWTWFVLGNLFALGAVCPFVGSLSDLFGRRYVAIFGAFLLIIGNIVTSTAHTMNTFIAGMAIAGAGAGINELTSLAVASELAPTKKRGTYVAALIFTILPFCPSVVYAQLIASRGTWRYVGLFCGVWAFIGLVLTAIFYHPPPREMTVGMSRREVLKRVDFIGGFLSVSGLLLFMAGIQWGGYQYAWGSAHVLAPMIIGLALFAAFCIYEWKFAPHPMFPRAIAKEPRILLLTLVITFISGSNFFSVLLFWPTQSYNSYGHEPLSVGIRNLALGFPILAGACIILVLIGLTGGRIRELMLVSCIFMTAGCGAMAALNEHNLYIVYPILIISGLGIGGVVVPASIISTIICPDELIATVAALTLAIRVLGGAIGYTVYYNVFVNKFKKEAVAIIGKSCYEIGVTNPKIIGEVIALTGASLLDEIRLLPGINTTAKWEHVVAAGQIAYVRSYPPVYYVSIAFGGISIICSLFLGDIKKYLTNHVAVHIDDSPEQVKAHHVHHEHQGAAVHV